MQFTKNMLLVGEGRLSGALVRDGTVLFFIDSGGAIIKKSMPEGRRGVKNGGFVSYADDYTEAGDVAVSLYGNEIEVVVRGS